MREYTPFIDLIHRGKIEYVGKGKIRAKLYDLGRCPGAVKDGKSYIHGEVHRISDEILPLVDEYEEFDPAEPTKSQFVREISVVFMEDGRRMLAMVYFYNGDLSGRRLIPTGRWKKPKRHGG